MIGAEKVGAVFGSFASPLVDRGKPSDRTGRHPVLSNSAPSATPVLDRGFRFLFRSCSSATMLAALSVDTIERDARAPVGDGAAS